MISYILENNVSFNFIRIIFSIFLIIIWIALSPSFISVFLICFIVSVVFLFFSLIFRFFSFFAAFSKAIHLIWMSKTWRKGFTATLAFFHFYVCIL